MTLTLVLITRSWCEQVQNNVLLLYVRDNILILFSHDQGQFSFEIFEKKLVFILKFKIKLFNTEV